MARAEGRSTLKSMLEEGLRAVIARYRSGQQFELRDASVPGDGLRPEFEDASWAAFRSASYRDRL
jgi:hypothetical protein